MPDGLHEIGVELARELWGDRFQVIVATHLNTKHFHNHFVFNSVSFCDGNRFHFCNEAYRNLRETSDRLCKEHDPSQRANGFLTLAGGVIITFAKEILNTIVG